MWHDEGDAELAEYAVPVRWIQTRDVADAIWEPDMFANQNSACRLRHEFTRTTLIGRFGLATDVD